MLKIQTRTLWGWADLKFSEDNFNYETETFASGKDAADELDEILLASGDDKELYRIVSADVKEDTDLYSTI